MKGKDIAEHIVRGEIPDMEQNMAQLRAACSNLETAGISKNKNRNGFTMKFKPIFIALIAIISSLLTMTALAVAFPEQMAEIFPILKTNKIISNADGTQEYPVERVPYAFSETLRKYIQNNEAVSIYENEQEDILRLKYELTFNSFDEASEFFGVPIKYNYEFDFVEAYYVQGIF